MRDVLFFSHLTDELELVKNWTTLNNWIAERGFPPGHMVGRRRAWTRREVLDWIESQPTENKAPLRGYAAGKRREAHDECAV